MKTFVFAVIALFCFLAVSVEAVESWRPELFYKRPMECLKRNLSLTELESKKVDDHFFRWMQQSFVVLGFNMGWFEQARFCLTLDYTRREKITCLTQIPRYPKKLDSQKVKSMMSIYDDLQSEVAVTVWGKATYEQVLECWYYRNPTDPIEYMELSPEGASCVNATVGNKNVLSIDNYLYEVVVSSYFFIDTYKSNGTKALGCLSPETLLDKAQYFKVNPFVESYGNHCADRPFVDPFGDPFDCNRPCFKEYLDESAIKELEGIAYGFYANSCRYTNQTKTIIDCAKIN